MVCPRKVRRRQRLILSGALDGLCDGAKTSWRWLGMAADDEDIAA
jgi:hypothetical protein